MDNYEVRFSFKFDSDLQLIEENQFEFGLAHTQQYIAELVQLCQLLKTMPKRFAKLNINGRTYRSFNFKAHRIFYQVSETDQTVDIITVVHNRQNYKQYL